MAKSKISKVKTLSELTEMVKSARGMVFANYAGLTVKDMQELRRHLRAQGISYEVAKKTLLEKAFKDAGLTDINVKQIQGMVSLATSATDEVEPAKQVVEFSKTHDKFKVLGGVMESAFIDNTRVLALAKLPSKQQLLGQLVGVIAAPMTGLVRVMQGNLRGLVQVLKARSEKQGA